MRNEKFVVTPELFNNSEGFYIVCKNQTEIDECLKQLHDIGLLWRSGEYLINKHVDFEEMPELTNTAKELAQEADGIIGTFMKHIVDKLESADSKTTSFCIGNPSIWSRKSDFKFIPYTVGYMRVSDWHAEDLWTLRVPRVLFSRCTFCKSYNVPSMKEISYGDEN